ncbi:hypothetical protein ACHAXS_005766 [Conticribra weissflogii]
MTLVQISWTKSAVMDSPPSVDALAFFALRARKRFSRAFDAAKTAELRSAFITARLSRWTRRSIGDVERLVVGDDALDKRPAFAAISANSALTAAAVPAGISDFATVVEDLGIAGFAGSSVGTILPGPAPESDSADDADDTVRNKVTLSQSILPSSSTPAPATCSSKGLSGSKSKILASFPSTSRTRFTQDLGTFALSILKYLV